MKAVTMDPARGVFDSDTFIEAAKLAMREVADCRSTIIYAIHDAIGDEPGDWIDQAYEVDQARQEQLASDRADHPSDYSSRAEIREREMKREAEAGRP